MNISLDSPDLNNLSLLFPSLSSLAAYFLLQAVGALSPVLLVYPRCGRHIRVKIFDLPEEKGL